MSLSENRQLPPGVTDWQWRNQQAAEATQALLLSLIELRAAGNEAAGTLFVQVFQPQPNGTMLANSICLAEGEEYKRISAAVDHHFGTRTSEAAE